MTGTEATEGWFSDNAATLGDRTSGAREAAGMDRAALAGRIGVLPRTLANWEDDQSEPRGARLGTLAGLTGVSLAWLLTGTGEGPESPIARPVAGKSRAILAEMRRVSAEIGLQTARLGEMETRLRRTLVACD